MGRQQAPHCPRSDSLQIFQERARLERVAAATRYLCEPPRLRPDSHHSMGPITCRRHRLEPSCRTLWWHDNTSLRQRQYAAQGQATLSDTSVQGSGWLDQHHNAVDNTAGAQK
jgi:hypothetical protein